MICTMASRYLFVNYLHRHESRQRVRGENPVDVLTDDEFLREYRISKAEFNDLCDLLKDDLSPCGHRSVDLS